MSDIYITVRKGSKVKSTTVLEESRVMVDKDENDNIVGIEVLEVNEVEIDGRKRKV